MELPSYPNAATLGGELPVDVGTYVDQPLRPALCIRAVVISGFSPTSLALIFRKMDQPSDNWVVLPMTPLKCDPER
ncbi:carotenoid cleavage dioxygenase [Penicillium robsamsonii]|uniref:carotenoid cleavage dioxygenase n=1 Tax=Penicillium robsamsonii TaxID=1792511 RepID=UPI0025466FE4|nr:carotenoid cleavage dioxygenase [Penicillium robsamsonii]KAJ5827169.1 carotenoid cleavage dioxygenase [Penicillium robsamsonii]